MNFCDICGKDIEKGATHHERCLRRMFGLRHMPKIDLAPHEVSIKAQEMAGKMSISGVQAKLSVKLNKRQKKLKVVAKGGEYILKPQIETFPDIPQNENMCMSIASEMGIHVPYHSLIFLKDGTSAYIVKRFDREKETKYHQEDFFQILGEEDKYSGSLEKIGHRLKEISDVPGLDAQFFFERVLFFFIIGNGDAHLKNFSILYDKEGRIRLSPAYDILSSKLVIPNEEDLALSMNGKKNKIRKKDFDALAKNLNIRSDICYGNILKRVKSINNGVENSRLNNFQKKRLLDIVKERISRLG